MTSADFLARSAHDAAERAGFVLDEAQLAALPALTEAIATAPGVYLHGPAGRGKTWLVDALLGGRERTARLHLHAFLARLHPVLFGYRMRADPDAVDRALRDVLGEVDLFVLDEFHTHDSGDARILTVVLEALRHVGVTVVLTSNYPPEDLLGDSPWAHTMADAIDLITTHYRVIGLDGGVDHRRSVPGQGFRSGTWVTGTVRPAGEAELAAGGRMFAVIATDARLDATFAQLCRADTAAMDFVMWARDHRHWRLYDVPALATAPPSTQQRFVTLVDVLSDADVRLDIMSALTREEFAARSGNRPDVFRTLSRLRLLSVSDHFSDS